MKDVETALSADAVSAAFEDRRRPSERTKKRLGGHKLEVAFDAIGGKAIDDLAEVVDDGGTIINFGSLGSNMGTNIIRSSQIMSPFAKRALKAGHKVKLSNSRGPDSLREIVNQLGPGATAATKEEAAACEMVLLAVPWDNVPETLASLPKWKNQILIDGTNPFHGKAGDFTPAAVGNLSTSPKISEKADPKRVGGI